MFEQLGFGSIGTHGGKNVSTSRAVAWAEVQRAWRFYSSDPTVTACRNVINGNFQRVTIALENEITEKEIKMTGAFKGYVERTWRPLIQAALDNIRVLGIVPYIVSRAKSAPPAVHILTPGSYDMIVEQTSDMKTHVECRSRLTAEDQAIHVFVSVEPNIDGTLRSPVSSLVKSMDRCESMIAAAVEDQLARARPPIITQERTSSTTSGEVGAGALQDLNMFMGGGATGDILSSRVDAHDGARAAQLSAQVQRAAQLNAKVHNPIGNQTDSGTLEHNALLALPTGQELAPSGRAAPLTQDVIAHRRALENQICAVMGVPMPLLNPGDASYKQDQLLERILNNELVRMEGILSDFLTQVYQHSFGPEESSASDDDAPPQDTTTNTQRITVSFPRHINFEFARDIYDREIFDESFAAGLLLQSLGLPFNAAPAKRYKTGGDATPAAEESGKDKRAVLNSECRSNTQAPGC